jgi:hypothetical protein
MEQNVYNYKKSNKIYRYQMWNIGFFENSQYIQFVKIRLVPGVERRVAG